MTMAHSDGFRNGTAYGMLDVVTDPQLSAERRFGPLLKTWRTKAGLSQSALAAKMAEAGHRTWAQSTVSQAENGSERDRPLRLDEFVSLCEILGGSPGITLTMLRGPEIQREAQIASLRARVIEATREARDAEEVARRRLIELEDLSRQLNDLEADAAS